MTEEVAVAKREGTSAERVVFYTHTPRAFRTTLIGHLYEICQLYRTVLVSEELDAETAAVLRNRTLFPHLDAIVPIHQFTGSSRGLFAKNRYVHSLAQEVMNRYKPDIVIAGSDMHSLFELYLFRFARRGKALCVAIQSTVGIESASRSARLVDLTNAFTRFPQVLPVTLRLGLVRVRKYLGHGLFYWVLPLAVGELPLWGRSSHILRTGKSGMRDVDCQVVFSGREFETFRLDGVPAQRLHILAHPLGRTARTIFRRAYLDKVDPADERARVITVLMPESTVGFRRADSSPITPEERTSAWDEVIALLAKVFPDHTILIKPHPDIVDATALRMRFKRIAAATEVVDPHEPVDRYVERAEFVLGLPLSASTALFTAAMQCPGKAVLSLDIHRELMGDMYKDFEGVEYVDSMDQLHRVLTTLREGKDVSRPRHSATSASDGWPGIVELLQSFRADHATTQKVTVIEGS